MSNLKNKAKPFFILLLILFVAYLPLSSFHFGMKNDAFSDNFPNKYFFSAALHAGYWPLWNPYLNFGFPIYADPGFAFWNPITWIFGLIGYTAYILTAEVLLYIYIAGVCMYFLCRYFKFNFYVCISAACMYMCSGFFIGSLQYINFSTSAAFLPLLILCFLKLQQKPGFKNAFWCAAGYYMVFSSGHPAIPLATIYFLVVLFLLLMTVNYDIRSSAKRIFFYNFLSITLFTVFYSPALYSYINVFPVYARNILPDQTDALNTGFSFSSLISLILPFSTAKSSSSIFENDVAMRNIYISIPGFICMLYAIKRKNKNAIVFSLAGIIMLLLSIDGEYKVWLYPKLPLLNFIRTNGEFRVFTVLGFCIAVGFGLNEIMIRRALPAFVSKAIIFIAALSLGSAIFLLTKNKIPTISIQTGISLTGLKLILDHSCESLFIFIACCISLLICTLLWLSKKNIRFIPFILIADIIINAIIYLPVTGIGRVTLKEIQTVYNSFPKGIPIPPLIPIKNIDTFDAKTTGLIGDKTYYNKQIGTLRLTDYPSYFTSTDHYFQSAIKNSIDKKPLL
ncbi:MAG: hypothetical protein ACTHJ5_00940 [Ilyomonas sp.]